MGTSSFEAMQWSRQWDGHCAWNQRLPRIAPSLQRPDASDIRGKPTVEGCRILTPFQIRMNVYHQAISALAARLRWTQYSKSLTEEAASIRLCRKALPGWTTDAAWDRRPTRNSNSLLVELYRGIGWSDGTSHSNLHGAE